MVLAVSGKEIAVAATIILPLVSAFIESAESSVASSTEKHQAVVTASEAAYGALRSSGGVKEIRDVPWELVAPLVVPVATGLISIIVGFFKSIGKFVSRSVDSSFRK